ncbi:acyl-CoA thioesterase [Nocardia macrotermitis]|uniref:Acyl-CoA thioesterase 2 n=1 Tax=Nocardia macrotermitis TaxID=2585198 RepID=A0A7K0CZ29_9NOCA|nr:acyl-CoA thioesterase domain-containing protein [Nocardia macrotermitis]MQY18690.1 Acyl-CoA thioesterase 2 [Nocardia macrotermitis]
MPDLWSDLLACLELSTRSSLDDETVFEGANQQLEYYRVFGGQLLGQFVRAAALSCPHKSVKSVHALFAREGRTDEPIRYRVRRHHEGRSFATVSIVAEQDSGVAATASLSMHAPEAGPERQSVPAPAALLGDEHKVEWGLLPWETRAAADLDDSASGPPEFEFWMRTPQVSPELAPAILAYATDLNLIGTALRPLEGIRQSGNGTAFRSAVTSHSLWFHREFRTDEWLLLRQDSPIMSGARCFGRGDVLTEDGQLVASYAQEAMVRFPQPDADAAVR